MSSIRTKILLIVAILAAGLLLIGGAATIQVSRLNAQSETTIDRLNATLELVDTSRSAQHHFKVQVQEWKNILIRGSDPALYEKHLKAFEAEEKLVAERLVAVGHTATKLNAASRINSGPILESLKTLGTNYRSTLSAHDPSQPDFIQTVDMAVRGQDRPVDKAIDAMEKEAKKLADEIGSAAATEMAEQAAWTRNSFIALLVATIIISGGISMTVTNGITKRICEVEAGMLRAQSTQDLTIQVATTGNDEIARMTTAFNAMITSFREVLSHTLTGSQTVAMASRQISATANALHEAATNQSESVSSSAAAVEELTTSISAVASHADNVRSLSSHSMEKTSDGTRRVEELVAEIHHIQDNVEAIATSVQAFVDATATISGMTQQVKDIADQTNLLALNAAIEAARAGEAGRGFAVVADEVRKLAEKSGASANEIEQVMRQIQEHSSLVSSSIDAGLAAVTTSVGKTNEVKQALQLANDDVAKATSGIADITASVKEQEIASTGIATNMEHIAQMTEETSASSEEARQAAAALHNLAEELRLAVSRFRT